MSFSVVVAGTPPRTMAMSKLVPPMSQLMRLGKPAASPRRAAAMTPAAGPDITVCTAFSPAMPAVIMPPLPCITSSSDSTAPALSRAAMRSR